MSLPESSPPAQSSAVKVSSPLVFLKRFANCSAFICSFVFFASPFYLWGGKTYIVFVWVWLLRFRTSARKV